MPEQHDSADVCIEPTDKRWLRGLREAIAVVARERRYLVTTQGFSLAATRRFVRNILAGAGVQFVALDGDQVVGWCDILRNPHDGMTHRGTLGIGLLPAYRRRGIGARLVQTAVRAARDAGMTRVELEVFATNANARALYEKLGFVEEGIKRDARILDGVRSDIVCMALHAAKPLSRQWRA